jgi:hypothetical protein
VGFYGHMYTQIDMPQEVSVPNELGVDLGQRGIWNGTSRLTQFEMLAEVLLVVAEIIDADQFLTSTVTSFPLQAHRTLRQEAKYQDAFRKPRMIPRERRSETSSTDPKPVAWRHLLVGMQWCTRVPRRPSDIVPLMLRIS